MDVISAKQMECYLNMAKSHAEVHSMITIKSNLGKHFLSQIKNLNNGLVFDKLNNIENKHGEQADNLTINKDIEFYKSKVQNLIQRLQENKMKLRIFEEKWMMSKMQSMEMMYMMEEMKYRAETLASYKESINSEAKSFKDYYDS